MRSSIVNEVQRDTTRDDTWIKYEVHDNFVAEKLFLNVTFEFVKDLESVTIERLIVSKMTTYSKLNKVVVNDLVCDKVYLGFQ